MGFTKTLSHHRLVEDWADIKNIKYFDENYRTSDVTFIITAKLIIRKRMKEDDILNIYTESIDEEDRTTSKILNEKIMVQDGSSKILFAEVSSTFMTTFAPEEGTEELEDVKLLSPSYARVYVNKEKKYAIVFQYVIKAEDMHYYAGLIKRLLPWFFDDQPLTKEETKYLESFGKTYVEYLYALSDIYMNDKFFYMLYLNNQLKDFNNVMLENAKASIRNELSHITSQIQDCMLSLENLYQRKNELHYKSIALNNDDTVNEDIMQYFQNDNTLKLNTVDPRNGVLFFDVFTVLSQWDDDVLETMINDEWSLINKECPDLRAGSTYPKAELYSDERYRRAFFRMLLNNEIKIRMSANYSLDIRNCHVHGEQSTIPGRYIGNPHLKFYDCLGQYEYKIRSKLDDHKIIEAIQLCQMSASSVNFAEAPTMEHFLIDIFATCVNQEFIEYKGEIISPLELLDYIEVEDMDPYKHNYGDYDHDGDTHNYDDEEYPEEAAEEEEEEEEQLYF